MCPRFYRNLASHRIITERDPDILTFCVAPLEGQPLSLPSWILDWSRLQKYDPSPRSGPGAYKASAETSFKGRIDFNTLSLDGVLLHRVVILGRAPNSNQLRGQDAGPLGIGKEAGDRLAESYKIFKQSRNYANYDLTAYV